MEVIIALLAAAIGLLIYMVWEAFRNDVIEQEIAFADFPESLGIVSIFFISDIHRRTVSDKIIHYIKGKADIIIIGGDITEKGVPLSRVRQNIIKLREIAPVYFVWGNNDYEVDYHELDAILLENKVKTLDNTAVSFESENGEKLCLLGIDDISKKRDRLDLALMDADDNSFKILASHNPQIVKQIKPEQNIRLVLSGHTHGGQIHLLGYSPYKKGGLKEYAQTTMLISNGYGTTTIPLRLGAPAECHLISLKRKQG